MTVHQTNVLEGCIGMISVCVIARGLVECTPKIALSEMKGKKHPESDEENSDNTDTPNQCVQGWKADDAQSGDIDLVWECSGSGPRNERRAGGCRRIDSKSSFIPVSRLRG